MDVTTGKIESGGSIVEAVDFYRIDAFRRVNAAHRSEFGQFPTPPRIARYMAGLFSDPPPTSVRLLDAGAGVGSLTAAYVQELCGRTQPPRAIHVVTYELDHFFGSYLADVLAMCGKSARAACVEFTSEIKREDFVTAAVHILSDELFGRGQRIGFNAAILNPPYRKIGVDSEHRRLLRRVGVETSNLYTAFLALATMLLEPRGEMVAITPRSFCNGPYFKPFRRFFLGEMSLRRIHVFNSRKQAFSEDDVLQENIIFHAVKDCDFSGNVTVSTSDGPDDEGEIRELAPDEVVRPDDADSFIRIMPDDFSNQIAELMGRLRATLDDLRLNVSTGRVVDFRSTEQLRQEPSHDTVPLIYPMHFQEGWIAWPKLGSKKANAYTVTPESDRALIASAVYVLTKRFSAKEEKRRIVAAIFDPQRVPCERVAFENHVNYFHHNGDGLSMTFAKGLSVYLNSTLVDAYFRNFNGHTQVNATDLRNLKYPTREQLEHLGRMIGDTLPDQQELDRLITWELLGMAKDDSSANVFTAKQKLDQALEILRALGMPREQQNERSALTLLALLDVKPGQDWKDAKAPLMGITPLMEYFAAHYDKKYAPNSRETVRRFTIHQFEQAGLVIKNPDKPRATNSKDTVYQIEAGAMELLRTFGTGEWAKNIAAYLGSQKTLQQRYAAEREMSRIPVKLPDGRKVDLTVGGQNVLIKEIIEKFCPHYTPDGEVLYVGDAGDKFVISEQERLAELGVKVDQHGKMPDVVVFHKAKRWLVLIEAVTSHGPVNPKRHRELKELFAGFNKQLVEGLVFVTAFLDRKGLNKYLSDIAWETEVWVAESPTHLIHFNGERFLGPYGTEETIRK
jgi:adenine-specific DNA-methyltransferase